MFPLAKASTSSTLSDIAAPEAGSWLDEKVEGIAVCCGPSKRVIRNVIAQHLLKTRTVQQFSKSVQARATALVAADIGKWQEELAGFARDYADGLQEVLSSAVPVDGKAQEEDLNSSFRVLQVPESLSKWASESLAATAKASHCHVGAVWCLVLAELRELDKQGVRVKRGKRASVRASKGSRKTGKEEMAPDLEGLDISLTNILDEITEEDGNLDWAWPDFDRDAFGSCQTVLTPTLELDIYCTVEDDTIEAVADACDAEVSDVLTFSTYFNSSLGADIPSLARCGLGEETLLVLRVRHKRVRGGAFVAVTGPAKHVIHESAHKTASSASSSSKPASSSSSSSSSSSCLTKRSRAAARVEHDPLKDLDTVELMATKRTRANVNYAGQNVDYSALH